MNVMLLVITMVNNCFTSEYQYPRFLLNISLDGSLFSVQSNFPKYANCLKYVTRDNDQSPVRKILRNQRSQKPKIEKGQTMFYKTLHRKLKS